MDPRDARKAQRQLNIALMLVAASLLMLTWRAPKQPPTPNAGTTTAAPAERPEQATDQVRTARLVAQGAPPYVSDLRLNNPAWAGLSEEEQVRAITAKVKDAGKSDPQVPEWILTSAWLEEHRKGGDKLEAARLYSSLGHYMQPDGTQSGGEKHAAYRFAAQAKLRAAELYEEEALRRNDPSLRLKKARAELEAVSSDLQRFGPHLVTLWEAQGDGSARKWVEVSQPYSFVLKRIDDITKDTSMYKVIDVLVRMTGGRQGWNVVLALIILAVGLKAAMYPLSRKSYRSMAEMQRMQPVIEELRKKHKDNPKKLNDEMMAVYREHGINPLGGCLPMVLQIPVFIFVYQGIRAYTYRFQVQFLWIDSLAGPDAVLLGVYAVSMFVTQWLTMRRQPKPADPSQAQTQQIMTWLMPIMFTYMMYMWKLPSAFYLYWLTFNVISTAEQALSHREVHGRGANGAPGGSPIGEVTSLRSAQKGTPTDGERGAGKAARKKGRARRGG